MPPVNLNLPQPIIDQLDARAAAETRSRSNVATVLLASALGVAVRPPNADLTAVKPDPRRK